MPLLSTAWLLCRAAKSFSSLELYSIQSQISRISHFCDSGSISAGHRIMFCPARSLYSWLYGDSLSNLVRYGYLKVVVGQLCVSESVYLFRNWFPNAGTSVFILMPHLRTRSCVFVQSLRNKHNEIMCMCQLSFFHTTAAKIGDTTSNNNQHIKRGLPTTDEQRGIELVSLPIDAKRPFPEKTCCSVCASDEYT